MGYLTDYYAMKDAEDDYGNVDWSKVAIRHGGTLNTGHPEDQE